MKELIQFNDFIPDQADLSNEGLTVANNVFPHKDGYQPMKELQVWSTNTLNNVCIGAKSVVSVNGTVFTFAGTSDRLYKLTGHSFSDVTRLSGTYSTGDSFWRFVQFGTNSLFATNFSDPIQAITIDGGLNFENLSPTAPVCKDIAIVNNFLVAANTIESDGAHPNRVRWSPIGSPSAVWGTDITTQTDFQDLFTGDFIIGIAGGEYGTVFCNNAIYKLTYVGSPIVFQIEEVERNHGLIGLNAFQQFESRVFYASNAGFFVFDGTRSTPIGEERVDRYFEDNVNTAFKDKTLCSLNVEKNVVMWHYVSTSSTVYDRALIYNYVLDKWCTADLIGTWFVGLDVSGYTLDELDPFGTMETLPFPLDSSFWKGGADIFGAFGTDNNLYYFTGNNKPAQFITSDMNFNNAGSAFIERIRPVRDGGVTTVSIAGRQKQSDPIVYRTSLTETSLGDMNIRDTARYQRIKTDITGVWNHAQGVIVDHHVGGFR